MVNISIRLQKVSDAKRFFEILNNPRFTFFSVRPKSVAAEAKYLKESIRKRKDKKEISYSILLGKEVIGSIGIKFEQYNARTHCGELGYFVDEHFWGKGVATRAVRLMEEIAIYEFGLKRLEILVAKGNKASQRVAIKSGYKKEGLLKDKLCVRGVYHDAYLFSKVM